MSIRRNLCILVLSAMVAFSAHAVAFSNVDVNLGPPEPQFEYVPSAREGYIWSPGYWQSSENTYVWTEGYWIADRPGFGWSADRWEYYDNGWRLARGHYYRLATLRSDAHGLRNDADQLQ